MIQYSGSVHCFGSTHPPSKSIVFFVLLPWAPTRMGFLDSCFLPACRRSPLNPKPLCGGSGGLDLVSEIIRGVNGVTTWVIGVAESP